MNEPRAGLQTSSADSGGDKQDCRTATEIINAMPYSQPAQNGHRASQSASIARLAGALAKAQLAFEPILKDTDNPFYKSKYADLAGIIKATQKHLAQNGLVIIQTPRVDTEHKTAGVETMLAHESGEWLANELMLPAGVNKFDAQSIGSAVTYARRYSYQSVIGVAAEVDDDANTAVGIGTKEGQASVLKDKLKTVVPALFYTHNPESDTYEISGSEELKSANRPILKRFWNPTAGTILCTGEQLEELKYELEQRKVEFRPLKGK